MQNKFFFSQWLQQNFFKCIFSRLLFFLEYNKLLFIFYFSKSNRKKKSKIKIYKPCSIYFKLCNSRLNFKSLRVVFIFFNWHRKFMQPDLTWILTSFINISVLKRTILYFELVGRGRNNHAVVVNKVYIYMLTMPGHYMMPIVPRHQI